MQRAQQTPLFSPLFERALRTAARWHRNDLRKGSDLPYITHPAAVAMILIRAGITDDCLLAAALLHDVVEDTACTLEEFVGEFPSEVIGYVNALSEHKLDEGGASRPWKIRKQEHLDAVADAPLPVRAIVLADKLHNLASMNYDFDGDAAFWSRFNATPGDILWYNAAMVDRAAGNDESLEPLAAECRRQIEMLRTAIGP